MFDYSQINFSTGAETKTRSTYMGYMLRTGKVLSTADEASIVIGENHIPMNLFQNFYRLPVVISVMGSATSGKNTFTELVAKHTWEYPDFYGVKDISIMDPIFETAKTLIDKLYQKTSKFDPTMFANCPFLQTSGIEAASVKDDAWRQFVHDMKMAWYNYHGSCVVNMVLDIIEATQKNMVASRVNDRGRLTSVIFIQNRDKETVDELEEACRTFGIIHLRLRIINKNVDATQFSNDADKLANEIPAHFTIDNSGTIDDLENKVRYFLDMFRVANAIYGVPAVQGEPEDQRQITYRKSLDQSFDYFITDPTL